MYCAACGTPLAAGLSFCNRCGASLKAATDSKTAAITAFLTAITLIGMTGLGVMFAGALLLKNEAGLKEELVGFFMLFTFFTITITEILLIRQLSRFTKSTDQKPAETPSQFVSAPELRSGQQRALPEPVASVTENTTRTLEYARNEPQER
ncbi:MAG: zinc ribbon domain-containing protein [Acidobacteriota bacterium]|nr:zinc ribbon domain-containing protein [Acidobacteriota bacterium]